MISLCKIKNKNKKPRSFHCRSDLRWYKAGREFTHPLWLQKKFPSGKKIWNVPESLHCVTWAVHKGHNMAVTLTEESKGQSFPSVLSASSTLRPHGLRYKYHCGFLLYFQLCFLYSTCTSVFVLCFCFSYQFLFSFLLHIYPFYLSL